MKKRWEKSFYFGAMTIVCVCVTIFCTHIGLHAKIIESDNLDIVLEHAKVGDLVVFDIDNTLSNPKTDLGSSPWFDYHVKQLLAQGVDFYTAVSKLELINKYIEIQPICNSVNIIRRLQKQGLCVIALTSRCLPVAKTTVAQMESLGNNFLKNSLYKDDMYVYVKYEGLYSHGIICSAHNNKGEILFEFLSQVSQISNKKKEEVEKITRIIFVDDRLRHVKEMEKAASMHGKESISIWLNHGGNGDNGGNGEDRGNKKSFSLEKTEKELAELTDKLGFDPLVTLGVK